MFDVVIIGGGTSGLMAACQAASKQASVLLLEKNTQLGRKLLLTGGGRCNVTNNRPAEEIIAHIPGNGRFLYSAFSQFNHYDIMQFFKDHNVPLKEEDHGRLFPVSNKAQTILDTFIDILKDRRVQVRTNATVSQIRQADDHKDIILSNGESIQAKAIIIATGGKSIPKTGSTGDGYRFAKQLGHTITPLFATEVPLVSDKPFKDLQGLSLRDIALSVLNEKGKAIVTHEMDMIFTHFGVSGPAVLRCSSFVYKQQQKTKKTDVVLKLDCLPQYKPAALLQQLQQKALADKTIKTALKTYIPERLVLFFLDRLTIDVQTLCKQLTPAQLSAIIDLLKAFTFTVNGSLPIEKSFVTGGGIHIKEIEPKTMMSKYAPGIFFCGEILDIHGYTGGYNITSAFVTGCLAGRHAALYAQEKNER